MGQGLALLFLRVSSLLGTVAAAAAVVVVRSNDNSQRVLAGRQDGREFLLLDTRPKSGVQTHASRFLAYRRPSSTDPRLAPCGRTDGRFGQTAGAHCATDGAMRARDRIQRAPHVLQS